MHLGIMMPATGKSSFAVLFTALNMSLSARISLGKARAHPSFWTGVKVFTAIDLL